MVIVQETTLFSQKSQRVRSRPLLEGPYRDHPESHNEPPRRSWFTAKILLILFCIFSWGVPLAMDIGMAAGDLYERTKAVRTPLKEPSGVSILTNCNNEGMVSSSATMGSAILLGSPRCCCICIHSGNLYMDIHITAHQTNRNSWRRYSLHPFRASHLPTLTCPLPPKHRN